MKIKYEVPEIIYVLFLYFLSVILVYFAPKIVAHAYLLSLLLFFYKSQKNYFWIALFFMLLDSPGFLLHQFDIRHNFGIYGISIGGGKDLFYTELLILVIIFKSWKVKGESNKNVLQNVYITLIIIIIALFFISFLYDVSTSRLLRAFRGVLPYTLFLIFPKILRNSNEYKKLFYLLFPFVFFIITIQLFEIFTGMRTAQFFGGMLYDADEVLIDARTSAARPLYSFYILEFIIIGTLYLLSHKKEHNTTYLYIILSFSILAVLISATRGILLAVLVMLILFLLFAEKSPLKSIKYIFGIFFSITIVFYILSFSPTIRTQFERTFDRLFTLKLLVEGDITAGGTLGRLDVRSPKIMNKIMQSPIIGFGFSDEYWEFSDGHLGHHNMVLNSGLIGYVFFILFVLYFLRKNIEVIKKLSTNNYYRQYLVVIIIAFVGFLVHHSTTYNVFSYVVTLPLTGVWLLLVLFFSFNDILLKECISFEYKMKDKI